MADQSAGDHQSPVKRERKGHFEEGSLGRACLLSFAASAAATLLICGAVRAPHSMELWHRIHIHRVHSTAKRQAKGPLPTSELSVSGPTLTEG